MKNKKNPTKSAVKKIAKSFIKKLSPVIRMENDKENKIELRDCKDNFSGLFYLVSYIDLGDFDLSFRVWFYEDKFKYDVEMNSNRLIDSYVSYDKDEIDRSIKYINFVIGQLIDSIYECSNFDVKKIPLKTKIKIAVDHLENT